MHRNLFLSAYQRLQPRLILQESEPFIPYKALLIVLSSVIHCCYVLYRHNKRFFDKFMLRQPLSLVLIAPTHATVALAFIPGSTHPCHSSSLVYAGLPHTNEHLCDPPSCSHPPCYLQDRDEIADDVIIAPSRNRCVKVTTVSVISSQCHLA